jgi:hypothetical protein
LNPHHPDFESSEVRGKRESQIENGRNLGSGSKLGQQKAVIRNSEFELKKSRWTKSEIFRQKYRGTSVCKVNVITEKLSSRIRTDCLRIRERFPGNEDIHVFSKIRLFKSSSPEN